MSIFHSGVPPHNLNESKEFYIKTFGTKVGQEYDNYIFLIFLEYQVDADLNLKKIDKEVSMYPRHYGIILYSQFDFDALYNVCKEAKVQFFDYLFEQYKKRSVRHFNFSLYQILRQSKKIKHYVNKQVMFY